MYMLGAGWPECIVLLQLAYAAAAKQSWTAYSQAAEVDPPVAFGAYSRDRGLPGEVS